MTSPVALNPTTLGLVALALLAAMAVALLALLRGGGLPGGVSGGRHLRALYEDGSAAALASSVSGRVLWTNDAAGEAGFRPGRPLLEQLASKFEVDDAALYRLSRRALDLGFALVPVEDRQTRQRCYLAAQSSDAEGLFWTVRFADHASPGPLVERDAAFETANFGHVSVSADGRISTNARFRELFGLHAKSVLERLPADRAPEGGRLLLPVRDGQESRERVFRVFSMADPARDRRDYLFFPTRFGAEEPAGPAAALDAIPLALLWLDLEGRIVWGNTAARKLLGDNARPGRTLTDVIEPLARPISSMLEAALRERERGAREMVRVSRGGRTSFLQMSLTRARLDENESLIAILADASQIRQLEDQFAQSQKMEAIGKLAGGVAHDFNNVLTAISGHADLLLLGKDVSHPDHSDLMQIRQNATRAAALVRQLLAFSRKQTLAPQELSLRDVVSDALYLLDRLIEENVALKLEHARDLGTVRADQQQLEQALMNLVVNARDAMPDGGTVTISTRNRRFADEQAVDRQRVPAGEYVEIVVEDDGPGVPEHLLDRIFEPFFTTKPVGEGTGLGLSTVYGIVKQSGGFLTASNRPEGGARFRILLPRVPTEAVASQPAEEPRAADGGRTDMTGEGVVLLVEDEAPVRSFASRALRLRGYQVEATDSAEAAMQYLARPENPVDLVVSDVVMPGMNGPDFAGEARKMRPGLPVIFVSGYAEDSFRDAMMDDDFHFLAKPFSLGELTAKVKDALSGNGAPVG